MVPAVYADIGSVNNAVVGSCGAVGLVVFEIGRCVQTNVTTYYIPGEP